MISAIRAFVRDRLTGAKSGEAAVADPADAQKRVQLAACALLLELAHADGEFTPAEAQHIEGALARHFGLDPADIEALVALADAERREAIDHFQFTRAIAEHYDLGQKMVLAEVMWSVILADGTVSDHEAHIVRKVANLLELEPAYLSQARAKASSARGNRP
jgi:uncharacterized tellurite resistance protein B-like protein